MSILVGCMQNIVFDPFLKTRLSVYVTTYGLYAIIHQMDFQTNRTKMILMGKLYNIGFGTVFFTNGRTVHQSVLHGGSYPHPPLCMMYRSIKRVRLRNFVAASIMVTNETKYILY